MRRILVCLLAAFVINLACFVPISLGQQPTAQDKAARKNMKYIKRLNKDDPVSIKLIDGTKIKGYVTEATDDHFVVNDRKTGQSRTINYDQVKDIGVGLSEKTKIGLGIAAGVLVLGLICGLRCKD